MSEFNLVIIGGGPAGYTAAIRATQLGLKVALIEKDKIGGTCLNRGCIPTKALLEGVGLKEKIEKADIMGIESPGLNLNFSKLKEWQQNSVNTLKQGVESILKKHQITVIKGEGQLINKKKIKIIETEEVIEGDNILLALGSRPIKLPISGADLPGVLTSKELLQSEEVPMKMVVIGGGVIGLEFANIYSGLGTDVTIIELEDRIIPLADKDISSKMEEVMHKKGIKIITNKQVEAIQEDNQGLSVVYGNGSKAYADKVLMAVGRQPNLGDTLALELDMKGGFIKVDEYYETSIKGVYAVGDILNTAQLAHLASAEANAAVYNIMIKQKNKSRDLLKRVNYKAVPSAVYTSPGVASVGLTEEEARENFNIETYIYPYKANGKAVTMNEVEGFVKIIKEKTYDEVVGVHIIGAKAPELIAGPTLGMNLEITTTELAETIHPHPTISEILMETAEMAGPGAIHWT
ncbi:MAG: dihydrolipoyl dehydrogenase [Bacillota bacterium]